MNEKKISKIHLGIPKYSIDFHTHKKKNVEHERVFILIFSIMDERHTVYYYDLCKSNRPKIRNKFLV